MNKFSLLTTLITPFMLLSGCVKEKVIDETDSLKIQFSAEETSSRAAIGSEGFPNGSAFSVWGYMTKESQTATVFEGSAVTKAADNSWNCNDIRYWFPGWNYNFYGVYPANLPENSSATVTNDGTITVTNFDCSATGAEAVDLMTAKNTGITYTSGNQVQPVEMNFSHELAKLNFIVKSENTKATITGLKVYGVNYIGTLTKSSTATWNPVTTSTNNETPYNYTEGFEFNTTNGWEKDIFGDVLLIPDSDLADATLEITYQYPGETGDRTSVIGLNTTQTTNWVAGQSYKYTLTIKGGSLTVNVTVNDWDGKDTSVSWE